MKKNNFISPGYIKYPSISLSGLHLSFFDEGLVTRYHLLAPVLTLYFDASGSFISQLPWIRNKDDKLKKFLRCDLKTNHFWKRVSFSFN